MDETEPNSVDNVAQEVKMELKEFLEKHGEELIKRLTEPIPPEVWEEAQRIKAEHAKAWAKIKDEPFTV